MKKIFAIIISVIVFTGMSAMVSAESGSEVGILKITDINGEIASCEIFKDENGWFLFPLRFIMEALGATVTWQADTGEVMLDFDGEKWRLDPDTSLIRNLQVSDSVTHWSGDQLGYSGVTGYYAPYYGISLSDITLLNSRYYIYEEYIYSVAAWLRSKLIVDNENHIYNISISPKLFYNEAKFDEVKFEIDNGQGGFNEITAIYYDGELYAIPYEEFMLSIGGEFVDASDAFADYAKYRDYLKGYESEVYESGIKVKDNIFLCVYDRPSYDAYISMNLRDENGEFIKDKDGNLPPTTFSYTIRNLSKDTAKNYCYVNQTMYFDTPDGNGEYFGIPTGYATMYHDKVYVRAVFAKNLAKYFGYELVESDDEVYIKMVSDKLDERIENYRFARSYGEETIWNRIEDGRVVPQLAE